MKISIIGSTKCDQQSEEYKEFSQACFEIGKAIATAKHTIVIVGDSSNTADYHVLQGVNSVNGKHDVAIFVHDDVTNIPYGDAFLTYPNVNFKFIKVTGPWGASLIAQITYSDGVIIISGSRGTLRAGFSAPILEKPVLSIPVFNGAAKEIWGQLEQDYKKIGMFKEIAVLEKSWSTQSAEMTVKAIEKLIKNNPYITKRVHPIGILFCLFILLFLWVVLLSTPLLFNVMRLFILLMISAVLGTSLRLTSQYFVERNVAIRFNDLISEISVGILVSFGLALLYLAGGITITGRLDFVNLANGADFERVAISMSLMGFGCALFAEKAADSLKSKFATIFSE